MHEEARAAIDAKELDLAEPLYRRGFLLQPLSRFGNRPYYFGILLNEKKKFTEARRWLNEAISTYRRISDPKISDAYKQLAYSYEKEEQTPLAVDNYINSAKECRWYGRRLLDRKPAEERATLVRILKIAQSNGLKKQEQQIQELLAALQNAN